MPKSPPKIISEPLESFSKEELIEMVKLLMTEVAELKRRVNMNSSNSGKPSSTDGYKKPDKNRSLKGKSDKKR